MTCTRTRKILKTKGLTLLEILISMLILGVIVTPIYTVFSGSRKTMMAARDLSVAVALAGTMMASIRQVDSRNLVEISGTPDSELPGPVSLQTLGIAQVPESYERRLSITKMASPAGNSARFFKTEVQVKWKDKNGHRQFQYALSGLLKAGENP